jgi:hypothetical protein
MKSNITTAAVALALASCTQHGRTGNSADAPAQSAAEIDSYLDRAEKQWAALATDKDPALLERILADDFVGTSEAGTVRNKAEEISYWAKQPNDFATASVPKMTYRHYGDRVVIARGDQTLTPKGGATPVRIIWTDTWLYRDGKWQVAGSQDAQVPADTGADVG